MPTLPVNIDGTYPDDPARPGIKAHQQAHDVLHALNNGIADPSSLARVADITAHAGAANPHTGYVLESTVGTVGGPAGPLTAAGKLPAAQAAAPANMVTTDSAQTITAAKTLNLSAATDTAMATRVAAEGFDRWVLRADGSALLGNGAAAPTLALYARSGSTALGRGAGSVDTSATLTAVGVNALRDNTTGADNTAVGLSALQGNTTGASNVAVGVQALQTNTTGANNTAVGFQVLFSNTTGASNVALGLSALFSNTSGGSNVAVGRNALFSNTTGTNNTAVGRSALYAPAGLTANATTTGLRQTALGMECGQNSATQRNDIVAVGYRALVDGDNTVALGSGAKALHAGAVALGQGSTTTAVDQVMVGARDIEVSATGKSLVIRSPNNTRYRIAVSDAGALSAVAA